MVIAPHCVTSLSGSVVPLKDHHTENQTRLYPLVFPPPTGWSPGTLVLCPLTERSPLTDSKIPQTKRPLAFPAALSISGKAAQLPKPRNAGIQRWLWNLGAAQISLLGSLTAGQTSSCGTVELLFTATSYWLRAQAWGIFALIKKPSATHKMYRLFWGVPASLSCSFCWEDLRRWKEKPPKF